MKLFETKEELSKEQVCVVTAWWKLTKLSDKDKYIILNGDIFEWHSEWQYEGDHSFYDYHEIKREWAILDIIKRRPEWLHGDGIFVKRVDILTFDNKVQSREVYLIQKHYPEDKSEDYAKVDNPLLLCLFDKKVAEDVYN
jgi:hypothetical protein